VTKNKPNRTYRPLIRCAVLGAFFVFAAKDIHAQKKPAGIFPVPEHTGIHASADTHAIAETIIYSYRLQERSPDSCIALLRDIIAQSRKAGFRRGIGGALAETGGAYLTKGNYGLAEQYILQSQTYPGLSAYTTDNAWNNLGLIYTEQGRYEKALLSYRRAMESTDQNVAVNALNNFTVLLMKLGRYNEMPFYLEKQKAFARRWKQDKAMAAALCNEAYVHLKQKNYARFDSIAGECLRLSKTIPDSSIYFIMTTNIGNSYVERGKPEQALTYFSRLENMIPRIEPEYQAAYYNEWGAALLRAGNYPAAIARLQQGTALAKKIGIADILEPTADLAEAFYLSGDYASAARLYRTHLALKDSLRDLATLNRVNEYEVRFRTVEKDKELLEKKLVILKQQGMLKDKNIQLGIILSLAALLTIAGIAMYRSVKNTRKLQAKALKIAQQQTRIKQLDATIEGEERERKRLGRELHDGIGSMLSALTMNIAALKWQNRGIPGMNELDAIEDMARNIAVEVRKSAHNLTPDYLLGNGLLHALQSLAAQIKTNEFALTVSGYGNIEGLQPGLTLTVYRILQELINNILKHAHARAADLQIRRHGDRVMITLEDDGIGFNTGRPAPGIGLKQIFSRIEAVNGHITVDSEPGHGTTVYMEFNLNNLNTAV